MTSGREVNPSGAGRGNLVGPPLIDLEALIDPDVLTAPKTLVGPDALTAPPDASSRSSSRWQKDCCQRRFPCEEPSMMEECHDVAGVSRED